MAQIILDHVEKSYSGGVKAISALPRHLHFFDPSTGLSIGHPKATAQLAERG